MIDNIVAVFGIITTLVVNVLLIVLLLIPSLLGVVCPIWMFYAFMKGKKNYPLISYMLIGFLAGLGWGISWNGYLYFGSDTIISSIAGLLLGVMVKLAQRSFLTIMLFLFITGVFLSTPIIINYPKNKLHFERQRESGTRGNLCALMSAIEIYHNENNTYPIALDTIAHQDSKNNYLQPFMPKYICRIPRTTLQKKLHPDSINKVRVVNTQHIRISQVTDEGGWIYSSVSGECRVNCMHKDTEGVYYFNYGYEIK